MYWLWIVAGLLLLLAGVLLTFLLRRTAEGDKASAAHAMRHVRLHRCGHTSRLVRGILREDVDGTDINALRDAAQPLLMHLYRLDRVIRRLPPLPANSDGESRLMELARETADEDALDVPALLSALSSWDAPALTSQEIAAFPTCIAAAECQRVASVLRALKKDIRERQAALRLCKRLQRCRQPDAVLIKSHLNAIGLAALLGQLRQGKQEQLVSLTEAWLAQHDLSAEALTESGMQRQIRLAEEIRRAINCFATLERINWIDHCALADELHAMLLNEPSGVYARMTAASQLELRTQIHRVSRHVRLDPTEVVHQAFRLCNEAEEHSLEGYIGTWFQAPEGLASLHRALSTHRGWVYAHWSLRREKLAYAGLWVFGIVTSFLFLHSRQPLSMLPFFALVLGCVSRFLLEKQRVTPLPGMKIDTSSEDLRTLIVLHAELADAHAAIQAVHRLKTALHAFPRNHVDFLLLGDFAPSITAVSSEDYAVIRAAAAAVSALDEGRRVAYLQRGRAWNSAEHRYCASAGIRGAITDICRLIAQGECESLIAFSTVEAASFERKYAYVLALPADRQPAHGLLERLLSVMAHPQCQRYPTQKGDRGYAMLLPEESQVFEGAALIRPDAFLEATDGLLSTHRPCDSLCGELAGAAQVPGAHIQPVQEDCSWTDQYQRMIRAAQIAQWQLPWVETPSGAVANPLRFGARFRLRALLRRSLVPLGQYVLLLFSVLTRNWPLLLIALLVPEIFAPLRRREDWLKLLCRLSLLPMRGAVPVAGLVQLLRRKSAQIPAWTTIEAWVQGLTATLMGALAFVLPGFAVPAFGLTLLFACFPLAHRFLETPVLPSEPLTNAHISLMDSAAAAIWRYFSTHVTEAVRYLPPCTVQFEPALGAEQATSPKAIGASLLACLCAKELAFLSADEAAARLRRTLTSIAALAMPFGLPCQRYALPSLTVLDAQVDAADTGFLLAALMTTAQALRTWLPELSPEYTNLSAEAARLADTFDLSRLFDREAMLFHAGLDRDGQGVGYIAALSDEALLLSVAGCALGLIPPEHLTRLERVWVAMRTGDTACSRHGAAADHLLMGLFLPLDERENSAFIRAMAARMQSGLFGQDACGYYAFDPSLRYRRTCFGVPDIATSGCVSAPVFAPHAAALCLAWTPHLAAEALLRFRELGALSPEGFCDAVDLSKGAALVGMHDTFHQGLTLMALSHTLAESPIRRYFCALPEVEACIPLLTHKNAPLILPRLPVRKRKITLAAETAHQVAALTLPAQAHLLGTGDFHLLADANGCSRMVHGVMPLTQSAEKPGALFGIQFYLADEGRSYRLGHALLPGTVTFAPGEVRYEQLCGSLRTELICLADTVRQRALHVLTITNLSTRDRLIDVADLLLPDLQQPPHIMETARPEENRLTLHARGTDLTLHHTMESNPAPLALHVCTDAEAFLGRGGNLHQPAALEEPASDLTTSAVPACLGFRAKFSLGGRGQVMLWLTTSLKDTVPLHLAEIDGIRRLAALQHHAIHEAAALTEEQSLCASRLVGLVANAKSSIAVLLETAEDLSLLTDLTAIARWFHLHGMPLTVEAFCAQEHAASVQEQFAAAITDGRLRVAKPSQTTDCKLVLRGDAPLLPQLDALYKPVTPPTTGKPPLPALLPKKELLHVGVYGGFDPETSDYIIQLEPRQTTPAPWFNRHISRYFAETVGESGFRAPFEEQVWLTMEDGTRLSPWSRELPRSVRMGPGQTSWEAWSDVLDIRLTAAPLPGERCALRVLSLRNATDHALTITITVLARLESNASLECAPGLVITDAAQRLQAFITGEGWEAKRTHAFVQEAVCTVPPLHEPDQAQGQTAQLSCALHLPPHASGKTCWLSGYARHGEDVARAMSAVQALGTSALLRESRAFWANRLDALTATTPEPTLSLLMNRILPLQALCAGGLDSVSVQLYLAPKEARRTLLSSARHASSREDWAMLALFTAEYQRSTQDTALWDAYLPQQDDTLLNCCTHALLSLPLDSHELPLGDARTQCFLYALAAHALDASRSAPDLQELARKLLNAADTYLWQDGCYGDPLRLDVQSLACLAYGANPRTRQAMHSCWAVLYDQLHGLIRRQMPTDAAILPGLPRNGGMVTLDVVLCLQAMLNTNHFDEAFELLRALNPLHHTDDPLRQETFRGAPYLLHGGMLSSPLQTGQAIPEGGAQAAGCLYAAVMKDVFGFSRKGSVIRLTPHVPPDWDEFTLTLREGASTWRISAERSVKALTIDGEETKDDHLLLRDDGKIHRVHFPMT